MVSKRWQDWVNLMLGIWLFASPWALEYAGSIAAWNAYALGAGIVAFAATAAYMPKVWEEVLNILLGVWLIVSPFVLGFSAMGTIGLNAAVVGILVVTFAVWAMFSDRTFYEHWHSGHSV